MLTDRFERGVQLLADNELSPALPEQDFKIIQPQLAASVAGQLQSPDYLAGRALRAALFPKTDPAQRETTPDTIKALTIQDVRNYYHYVFRPDMTTIIVIGNVTPENAVAVISKYFGDWKAEGPKAQHPVPAGAGEPAFHDARPGFQPRAGQGDAGGNADAHAHERRLLCAATGQSRARRRLLCNPFVS